MYYVEVRRKVQRNHQPVLLANDLVWNTVGWNFRSVYAYTEQTKDMILSRGHARKLNGVPLYSDVLFIDIDDDALVQKAGDLLVDKKIGFEYWHTGNRGAHFHVPIKPMFGKLTAHSQRQFLKEFGLYELIDQSIYNSNGLIRMPGSKRESGVKRMLERVPGKTLEIPQLITPPPKSLQYEAGSATSESLVANLTRSVGFGRRHQHIMIIVKDCKALGLGLDKCCNAVIRWNKRWARPPMSIDDAQQHVLKTWEQVGD